MTSSGGVQLKRLTNHISKLKGGFNGNHLFSPRIKIFFFHFFQLAFVASFKKPIRQRLKPNFVNLFIMTILYVCLCGEVLLDSELIKIKFGSFFNCQCPKCKSNKFEIKIKED